MAWDYYWLPTGDHDMSHEYMYAYMYSYAPPEEFRTWSKTYAKLSQVTCYSVYNSEPEPRCPKCGTTEAVEGYNCLCIDCWNSLAMFFRHEGRINSMPTNGFVTAEMAKHYGLKRDRFTMPMEG